MIHHFSHRSPIGYNEPFEVPLFFQQFFQQKAISGSRFIIKIIKCAHKRSGTRFSPSLVRRHIKISKLSHGHIHTIVVFSRSGSSITCKMLDTRKNCIFLRQVISLESAYTGLSDQRTIIRIFSRTFHHTSPTGIPANIHHRSKSPVQSGSRRFLRRTS